MNEKSRRPFLSLGSSPFRLAIWKRTWHCFQADRIPLVSAGAAFFIVLAVFPAFASIVALFGMFSDRAEIAQLIYRVSDFLPRGGIATLNNELQRLIAQPPQAIGLTFVAGAVVAVLSASSGVKAILEGLDIAYEVRETRHFIRFSLVAILVAALGIFVAALSLNLAVILPLLLNYASSSLFIERLAAVAAWPSAFLISLLVLSLIYRYGPNRQRTWHWFSWGAVLASVIWLAGTAAFKFYVRYFGSFDQIYGSLGGLIGFMVWIWMSVLILLLGAELNCEVERHER